MRADPKVRRDKKCVVCGKPRDVQASRKYAGQNAVTDPFCGTKCCRKYHGTEETKTGSGSTV